LDRFEVSLPKSAQYFLTYVYPQIEKQQWFKGGYLVPVEATNNEMAKLIDQYSSIDYWNLQTNIGIRGLASRVQYNSNFDTFTVRKERIETGARTEFEKLSNAIQNNWLYPYWFCQAYIYLKPYCYLNSIAICKTNDLIEYICNGVENIDWKIRTTYDKGAADFYAVPWDLNSALRLGLQNNFESHYEIRKWSFNKVKKKPQSILDFLEENA
jgi:hypothetical protein